MNVPRLDLHPLQRRALMNAGIATAIALVVGFSALALFGGGGEGSLATASPTRSMTPTTPPCAPAWDIVQAADPGEGDNTLHGVTVLAAGEGWAVGASGQIDVPRDVLLERWDGIAWTAEQGPSPGSEANELLAVDASEPNDVWAVGRTASGLGDRPLIVHYDGSAWTQVDLPLEVTGIATGVAAVARNDVWVVGYTGDVTASLNTALLLHWDGQLWAVVDAGRAVGVGASLLRGISATGPDDVWAVGELHNRPLMIHYDGSRWERLDTDVRGVANAIVETAPGDAWAVGSPIQRFDGTTWSQAANVRGDGELFSVTAVSPNDVWAVGLRPSSASTTRALVLRFDGQRWGPVDGPPVPGSDALTAIDALPDGTLLAVGYKDVSTGRRTLAARGTTCGPGP
jgi:hypothetical protein